MLEYFPMAINPAKTETVMAVPDRVSHRGIGSSGVFSAVGDVAIA